MPHDPVGDALHLALASYHKCEFLLTWNCNHLANANKFGHIRHVNDILGLFVPMLAGAARTFGRTGMRTKDDPTIKRIRSPAQDIRQIWPRTVETRGTLIQVPTIV